MSDNKDKNTPKDEDTPISESNGDKPNDKKKDVKLPEGPRATRSGKPLDVDPSAHKRGTKRKAEAIEDEVESWVANPPKERKRKYKPKEEYKPVPVERKKLKPREKGPKQAIKEEVTWNDWKDVFLLGTEWDFQEQVVKYNWNFNHLQDMLEDTKSELHAKKQIHLIGATEAHTIGSSTEVIQIPVITAIVSDLGPLPKVGVTSVQKEEEVVDMDSMKLLWKPYYPEGLPRNRKDETNIYMLHCNERASRLKNLKKKNEEDFHRYQYLLGYHVRPQELLDEKIQLGPQKVTVVEKIAGVAAGVHVEYNYARGKLDEVLEETYSEIEEGEFKLNNDQKENIKQMVLSAVEADKEKRKAKMEECKKAYERFSPEMRDNLTNLKTYKFYPQNKTPNVASIEDKKVNRYFGNADGVHPAIPEKAAFKMLW